MFIWFKTPMSFCRYIRAGYWKYIRHYDDVIMNAIASQITSLMIVYSIVYSDADQSKHQSSASLAFVWGIHRDRWIPRTKGQLRGKCFHLMTSPWYIYIPPRQLDFWLIIGTWASTATRYFFAGIVIYELHLSAADIYFRYIYIAQCETN